MTAPFLSLRAFLEHLEAQHSLQRIRKAVDKNTELACIVRWVIESTPRQQAGGLLFENIAGYKESVAVNLFPNRDWYAAALGVQSGQTLERWARAIEQPHAPVIVETAAAQEVVTQGTEVDAGTMPAPVWTPGRDASPYLSAGLVITKDPDTGVQNLASYRVQVQGPRRLGLFFGSKLQHGAIHHARHSQRNLPTPVAVVVGAPPAVCFAAAAKTPYGVDEMTIAGGLAGLGLEVVKGRTVDLYVPAEAEYVIEGVVTPNAQAPEGPFGEALGYMNDAAPAAYIDVTAITHRRNPIHHGYVQQLPPSEGHLVMEMGILGPLWHALTRRLRLEGIIGLGIAPGSAGVSTLVVQLAASHRERAASIGKAIAQINFGQKFIYLVDEDIDLDDAETLNWALSARVDPHRDITLVDGTNTFQLDPSVLARFHATGKEPSPPPYKSSLAIVDATLKCKVPAIALPAWSQMEHVLKRWDELELDPILPRKRLVRLLQAHSADEVRNEL